MSEEDRLRAELYRRRAQVWRLTAALKAAEFDALGHCSVCSTHWPYQHGRHWGLCSTRAALEELPTCDPVVTMSAK